MGIYTIEETNFERQYLLAQMLNPLTIRALESFRLPPGSKILDLGCGLGETTRLIKKRFPGTVLTGLDQDASLIELAVKNVKGNDSSIHFVTGSAMELPFADNSIDFVFTRYLLHHLPNALDGLREMKRVCKIGGIIFAQEPDVNFMQTYPESGAFPQFKEFVNKLFVDALVGRKLISFFKHLSIEKMNFQIETILDGGNQGIKKFYAMTAEALGKSIVEHNYLDKAGVEAWIDECWRLSRDPDTILLLYPTIAVWGTKE